MPPARQLRYYPKWSTAARSFFLFAKYNSNGLIYTLRDSLACSCIGDGVYLRYQNDSNKWTIWQPSPSMYAWATQASWQLLPRLQRWPRIQDYPPPNKGGAYTIFRMPFTCAIHKTRRKRAVCKFMLCHLSQWPEKTSEVQACRLHTRNGMTVVTYFCSCGSLFQPLQELCHEPSTRTPSSMLWFHGTHSFS